MKYVVTTKALKGSKKQPKRLLKDLLDHAIAETKMITQG